MKKFNRFGMRQTEKACILFGSVLMFFGIIPMLFQLIVNLGTLLLCLGGLFFLAGGIHLRRQRGLLVTTQGRLLQKKGLLFMNILLLLALAFFLIHGAVWNYFAYFRPPAPSGESTVVVLGCKITGEKPSLMLRRRLDRAFVYLNQNPDANCVVSGGVGVGQQFSEAHVMKKYLTEKGIDDARIFLEENSTNTDTNLKYSANIIAENSLSQNLILCTDNFHQWRAYLYGRRYGFSPKAISCSAPFFVIPSYALREFCGILKMVFLG